MTIVFDHSRDVQNEDAYVVSAAGEFVQVRGNGRVTGAGQAALHLLATADDAVVLVADDLTGISQDSFGLLDDGDNLTLSNMAWIRSYSIALATHGDATIENRNSIWSEVDRAIITGGGLNLTNDGYIAGEQTIFAQGQSIIQNNKNGYIDSYSSGAVIILQDGEDSVINAGTIHGDVFLGEGKDVFDTRLGVMEGKVYAGGGQDVLRGGAAADLFFGDAGNDVLYGFGGADTLYGGAGADRLDGGAGADRLDGGDGIDTACYETAKAGVVVSLAQPNINEGDAAGDSYLNIENVRGGAFGDLIYGDAGANRLDGGAGADTLVGEAGDLLVGGAGDDTFQVSANTVRVFETAGGGTDTVIALDSYRLSAGQEIEVLRNGAETKAMTLIGNEFGNAIYGGAKGDTLIGLGGDDFIADAGASSDRLNGGEGADTLNGGLGADVLTGGSGADVFVFDTRLVAVERDVIVDFNHVDDTIQLSRQIFSAAGPAGALADGAFHVGAVAADPDDRIIYNQANGGLYYDADGAGGAAATLFAILANKPLDISAADFVLV